MSNVVRRRAQAEEVESRQELHEDTFPFSPSLGPQSLDATGKVSAPAASRNNDDDPNSWSGQLHDTSDVSSGSSRS